MNFIWHIVNLFFFVIGCYLSIFSAFIFDAPNSTSNPFNLFVFFSIISIPILSILGLITGNYIYPLITLGIFTGWIILLVYAISILPFTTIKYNNMKQFMNDLSNRFNKKIV